MSDLRIALTFDAEHPSRPRNRANAVISILDALALAGARATFFVQGRWASAFPDLARRIAVDGHAVGSHSNYHARMTMLSLSGIARDVAEAEERIVEATGVDPRPWFRCPFGDGADRADVLQTLAGSGYRDVGWNVDTLDWHPETLPEAIVNVVADAVAAGPADPIVVLQHAWSAASADALSEILVRLAAAQASFVTIAELLDGR